MKEIRGEDESSFHLWPPFKDGHSSLSLHLRHERAGALQPVAVLGSKNGWAGHFKTHLSPIAFITAKIFEPPTKITLYVPALYIRDTGRGQPGWVI